MPNLPWHGHSTDRQGMAAARYAHWARSPPHAFSPGLRPHHRTHPLVSGVRRLHHSGRRRRRSRWPSRRARWSAGYMYAGSRCRVRAAASTKFKLTALVVTPAAFKVKSGIVDWPALSTGRRRRSSARVVVIHGT